MHITNNFLILLVFVLLFCYLSKTIIAFEQIKKIGDHTCMQVAVNLFNPGFDKQNGYKN